MFYRVLGPTFAGIALVTQCSYAQSDLSVALDKFEPAPAGDTFWGVSSSQTSGHLVVRGRFLFVGAQHGILVDQDGAGPLGPEAFLSTQTFLHAGMSIALWNRVLLYASLPIAVSQHGDGVGGVVARVANPSGAESGDFRWGIRMSVYGTSNDVFQISSGVTVYTPTAPANSYVGDGSFRIAPELLFSGKSSILQWSVMTRPVFHNSGNPSTIVYGAAMALSFLDNRLHLGPEFFASTPLAPGAVDFDKDPNTAREFSIGRKTNLEIWLGVQSRVFRGLWLGAAGGPGIGTAIGTPRFRVMGMISWSPADKPRAIVQPKVDSDGDGWTNDVDVCPYAFGDRENLQKRPGCPWIDTDEDGTQDAEDVCPDEPVGPLGDPKRRGCPADRDHDGVRDVIDVCPDATGETQSHGCPPQDNPP